MRLLLLILSLSLVGVLAKPVPTQPLLKWGLVGHSTVGAIAQNYLNSTALAAVKQLLANDPAGTNLSAIASWADDVKYSSAYLWSGQLHYINTPDWACNYSRSRDCKGSSDGAPNACVDEAIQNYTSRLGDLSLDDDQRGEALKFLVHFIGDIMQPLHVGFTTDEGGNTQKGTFFTTKKVALHTIWDVNIITQRVDNDFDSNNDAWVSSLLTRLATGDFSSLRSSWETCANDHSPNSACSQHWADESIVLACDYAYVEADGVTHIENGFNLQQDWYDRTYPIVELQVAKAGIRLANVLNSIFA